MYVIYKFVQLVECRYCCDREAKSSQLVVSDGLQPGGLLALGLQLHEIHLAVGHHHYAVGITRGDGAVELQRHAAMG